MLRTRQILRTCAQSVPLTRRLVLLGLLSGLAPLLVGAAPARDASTWASMRQRMAEWQQRFPQLIHQETLGKTVEGRDIPVLRVSADAARDTGKPEVLLMAGIHPREQPPQWATMQLVEELLEGYGKEPRVTRILDTRQVWIIPVLNVDGKLYDLDTQGEARDWRKNRRKNADGSRGVDLNRNFGVRWGGFRKIGARWKAPTDRPSAPNYEGPAPFSEPETRALADFFRRRPLRAFLDFHSPLRQIYYPAYTVDPEHTRFQHVAQSMREGQQVPYPTSALRADTEPLPGDRDGDTGLTYTWAYYTRGIYGFNLESGLGGHYPTGAEMEAEYRANLREPLLRFLEQSAELPLPLPGSVTFREATTDVSPAPGAVVSWKPQVDGRADYGVVVSEDPAVVVQSEYRLFPVKTGFTLSISRNGKPGARVPLTLYVWDRDRHVSAIRCDLIIAAP